MKFIVEIEMEEHHCTCCRFLDTEDRCELLEDEKRQTIEFESFWLQMENCPLKEIEE